MEPKKIVGICLLIAGITALILSLGADALGVGGNNSVFGPKQIFGTIGGIVLVAVGLFLVLKRRSVGSPKEKEGGTDPKALRRA
jgi:hypothetical protein